MIKFLPYILLMLSIDVYGQQGESLYSQYQDVKSSFFTSEITFRCQSEDYKFRSNILTPGELYVKEGLDWVRINDIEIRDGGISFEELMRIAPPDISRLRKSHEIQGIGGQDISNTPSLFHPQYSYVTGNMRIEIDFLEERYRYTNTDELQVPIHMNEDYYVRSQRMSGLELNTWQLAVGTHTMGNDFRYSFELISKETELATLQDDLSRNNFVLQSRENLMSNIAKLEEEISSIKNKQKEEQEIMESNETSAYAKLAEYGEMDLYAYIPRGTLSRSYHCFATE
ncbi:OmpH family outer membrane protein [Halomonas sp. LBP4]|uniref:OmpH family outer membrane protein n=1 Tax=Halomonas sp. LBP4 TaxID=2044917 RepID=UPI0011B35CDF|nr:OmpH family outer membrane protein [Halomonas sp. LBP4]